MITRSDHTNDVPPESLAHRAGSVPSGEHVSPARAAAFWGVHVHTVYRDIRKGALRAFRMPGGQLRILVADMRRYGRPVD